MTVVIPVYNGMPYLPETVDSVLAQTYASFLLLLVNDGSTDGSAAYLDSLRDERVQVWHKENTGLCDTLNRAIRSCETELVARLDQDDVSVPTRLAEQVAYLDAHPETDCVLTQVSRISSSGREFAAYRTGDDTHAQPYDSSVFGCIANSTLMIRQRAFEAAGGYRPELYPADDYDLLLRLEERGRTVVLNEPLVKYRVHEEAGTFATFAEMDVLTAYAEAASRQRAHGQRELPLEEFRRQYAQAAWPSRLGRAASRRGRRAFRRAGARIGEGQLVQGAGDLMTAVLLAPVFSVDRLTGLVGGAKSR
ncbi:MAG: glycosyltransferase family A protein [Bacteroidota bacterium]